MMSDSPAQRTVIIGGGYAGLACAIALATEARKASKSGGGPRHTVEVVTPGPAFLKLAYLHRSIHTNHQEISVAYREINERFGVRFHDERLAFDLAGLRDLSAQGKVSVAGTDLPFDQLVVTSGATSIPLLPPEDSALLGTSVLTQEWIAEHGLKDFMQDFAASAATGERTVTVVGGGPTGIQYVFELYDFFRRRKAQVKLRLLTADSNLLVGFPDRFHKFVLESLSNRGIDCRLSTRLESLSAGSVAVKCGGVAEELNSDLTLLFPGVRPAPEPLPCDIHGRVFAQGTPGGEVLSNVYAAGDCAPFEGSGLNAMSAQAAVRKGKLVAENILNTAAGKKLKRYNYRELGYFLSLGYWDGIGWLALRGNILTGLPAFAAKEAIEQQFNLYLGGLDTYVNPFALL